MEIRKMGPAMTADGVEFNLGMAVYTTAGLVVCIDSKEWELKSVSTTDLHFIIKKDRAQRYLVYTLFSSEKTFWEGLLNNLDDEICAIKESINIKEKEIAALVEMSLQKQKQKKELERRLKA